MHSSGKPAKRAVLVTTDGEGSSPADVLQFLADILSYLCEVHARTLVAVFKLSDLVRDRKQFPLLAR